MMWNDHSYCNWACVDDRWTRWKRWGSMKSCGSRKCLRIQWTWTATARTQVSWTLSCWSSAMVQAAIVCRRQSANDSRRRRSPTPSSISQKVAAVSLFCSFYYVAHSFLGRILHTCRQSLLIQYFVIPAFWQRLWYHIFAIFWIIRCATLYAVPHYFVKS